jgi:Uma2 family endonuclease
MRAQEFIRWASAQTDDTRYELVAGEVVAMAPERLAHAQTKALVWQALHQALVGARLDCIALPDGMAVTIDDGLVYEPDALVRCGAALSPDTLTISDPVMVVEVLSPSTRARDSGAKLEDYFRLASLVHYLIVKTETRSVIHHQRQSDGGITTRILRAERLELSPPGITVDVASFFAS